MRWVGLVLRIFGWLLTPAVALAAAFFGSLLGLVVANRLADPVQGLAVAAAAGAIAGFGGILLWLRLLRTNPGLRRALAVSADGTPDTIARGLERALGEGEPSAGETAPPPDDPDASPRQTS